VCSSEFPLQQQALLPAGLSDDAGHGKIYAVTRGVKSFQHSGGVMLSNRKSILLTYSSWHKCVSAREQARLDKAYTRCVAVESMDAYFVGSIQFIGDWCWPHHFPRERAVQYFLNAV
jgi:hypothetical protein